MSSLLKDWGTWITPIRFRKGWGSSMGRSKLTVV